MTSNAILNFAIEQYIKFMTQYMMWVHQENDAAPMSNEYLIAADMRNHLDDAKVRYKGAEIYLKKIVDYTLEYILTEDESDEVIEEIGGEDALYKRMHEEATKRANAIEASR